MGGVLATGRLAGRERSGASIRCIMPWHEVVRHEIAREMDGRREARVSGYRVAPADVFTKWLLRNQFVVRHAGLVIGVG